jgi:tryptophan synthase beta chain
MKRLVDERGFFGPYGGAFIPEMLYPNVLELQEKYEEIMFSDSFKEEYKALLKDYAGRPTPLFHAKNLSSIYGCNVLLKREDLAHTGSHKINNTLGQILIARHLGKKRIIAETGAGQHGVATATVCALLGLDCTVFMGARDTERQAPNLARMKMLGARVVPVESGSKTLKDATNEAIREWTRHPSDTHYIIGSVVGPHPYPDMVARLQSIISEELRSQLLEATGNSEPYAILACLGGGSNAAGSFFHYLDVPEVRLVVAEAAGMGLESGKTAATTWKGSDGVLHGSKTILMQTEDGQVVEPHSISAGLDYPGIGPMLANLIRNGRVESIPVTDEEALVAGCLLAEKEGIIPALESAHAVALLEKMKFESHQTIVVTISGRGDKDMDTYIKYLENE